VAVKTFLLKGVLYVDILGYQKKAREEAEKTGRPVEDIRNSYIVSIEERLNDLKKRGIIAFHTRPDYSDAWLAFTESVPSALKIVGEISKAQLPLGIAISAGTFEHSHWTTRSDKIVAFLKTDIISDYMKFYKNRYHRSPVRTFILLTPQAYERIEFKGICARPHPTANFYLVKQEGLERELRMLAFLKKINLRRVEYREIEKLYVEPNNYEELKGILDEHHIVFLVGDAEEGKTYTAIRLLLEYSKEYNPIYVPEERKREQWEFIRGKRELEGKITYLEDPWGKVEFERIESLFSDIGTFIAEAKRKKCKIIVTSREKVFREFEKRKETTEDLYDYVARFKVHLTYSVENLSEMLEKYVNVFEPRWGKNKKLRNAALEAVGEELRTPMSIKKLMDYSRDAENMDKLQAAIEKAAADTKITFAREIKEMFNRKEYDKLVCLSLVHIGIEPEIAKSCYRTVLKELGCDLKQACYFDDLLYEFDEVETTYVLRFIHPCYWDAFNAALTDSGKPNNMCRTIFCPVLLILYSSDEAADAAAWAVARNFDKIPEDLRNKLLFDFCGRDEAAEAAAWTVARNFDKIPEGLRNNILFELYDRYEAVRGRLEDPGELSLDMQNKLLLILSDREKALRPVARAVTENFDRLPRYARVVLFALSQKQDTARYVAWGLEENFNKIPQDVRNRLLVVFSKNEEIARTAARIVARNFNEIPQDVRNRFDRP